VAESLVGEANDITVVDSDAAKLRLLQDRLDLRTLTGNAAIRRTEQAGIADTDMLLAVTQSEVSTWSPAFGRQLYNTPTRIARIRAADLNREEVFSADNLRRFLDLPQ
jgi:trk system potassium uptake protein TrkA